MSAMHEMVAVNVVVLWLVAAAVAGTLLHRRSEERRSAGVLDERVSARPLR